MDLYSPVDSVADELGSCEADTPKISNNKYIIAGMLLGKVFYTFLNNVVNMMIKS